VSDGRCSSGLLLVRMEKKKARGGEMAMKRYMYAFSIISNYYYTNYYQKQRGRDVGVDGE
jgi:hypothetical protein